MAEPDTSPTHWVLHSDDQEIDPDHYFGFIYLIYNKRTYKKYIGKKQFKKYKKNKPVGYSDWKSYTGSSKYLNEDIRKLKPRNFVFVMIRQLETRGGLVYSEANAQHRLEVMTKKLLGSQDREYYNGAIAGIRFIPKEVIHNINNILEEVLDEYCTHHKS